MDNLNKPNELYGAVIQLQRFCGQPLRLQRIRWKRRCRSNRGDRTGKPRQEGEPDVAQPSCVPRRIKLPAVFPSLHAHEPMSCRARDPSGPGPLLRSTKSEERHDYFHLSHPAVRTVPDTQEGNLQNSNPVQMARVAQFTNLRMRTFIATPSARNVNNTEDPP